MGKLDMTWADFGKMHDRYARENPTQRPGQIAYNVFHEVCPSCAERISGTEYDPFYDDSILEKFLYAISSMFKEVPDGVRREAHRRRAGSSN